MSAKELEIFLKNNPRLMAYQEKLEREMDSVPEEFRLVILAKHILWNLDELETELKLLQSLGNSE